MPSYPVKTDTAEYTAIVERGLLSRLADFIPADAGKVFVVTTDAVWKHHGAAVQVALQSRPYELLSFPEGETGKRFTSVERAAEQMVEAGGDRTSVVIAFGGGIVNDMGGFLAAIFMRGIPVIQVPTTLLAQVDAAIGGKTGVNLHSGKNLIGAFHQPLAVIIDPDLLRTLPSREYRAGLFEVIKYGVIASPSLFDLLRDSPDLVLNQDPSTVDRIVSESVRIKAEVVSADEREGGVRKILNFGHTVGHALEAETGYAPFLHGEAVGFGMLAATHLAARLGLLSASDCGAILDLIPKYGPIPTLGGIRAEPLLARLKSDKKTLQGNVHFVLPDRIGHVRVLSGIDPDTVRQAVEAALA